MPSSAATAPGRGAKRGSLTGAALTNEVFDSSPTLLQGARGGKAITGLQQYFTPPEAAELTALVNGRRVPTLDLTAGDGGLLAPLEPDFRFGIEIDADQIGPKFYEPIQGGLEDTASVRRRALDPFKATRRLAPRRFPASRRRGNP